MKKRIREEAEVVIRYRKGDDKYTVKISIRPDFLRAAAQRDDVKLKEGEELVQALINIPSRKKAIFSMVCFKNGKENDHPDGRAGHQMFTIVRKKHVPNFEMHYEDGKKFKPEERKKREDAVAEIDAGFGGRLQVTRPY